MHKARFSCPLLLLYPFIATHRILERGKEKGCIIRTPFVHNCEHMLEEIKDLLLKQSSTTASVVAFLVDVGHITNTKPRK